MTWMLPGVLAMAALSAGVAQADQAAPDKATTRSMLDFVHAGGPVGYVIIALSLAGTAMVVDACVRLRADKLIPPRLADESRRLALAGRFNEIISLSQASDSVLGRILGHSLQQGALGMDAIGEAMEDGGVREVTRLQQRVGHIGFIAAVAPMLGLLGTVTGMIGSFDVLGTSKGSAEAGELAVGVAEALVTTCMGLIVAVPLMFFHNMFLNRVTRIGQEASGHCVQLLRSMKVAIAASTAARAAGQPGQAAPGPRDPAIGGAGAPHA